jgi:hypothetical protein
MRGGARALSTVRADRGTAFWLWFAVKLALGLSQVAGAVVVLVLYLRQGPSSTVKGWFLGSGANGEFPIRIQCYFGELGAGMSNGKGTKAMFCGSALRS